MKQTTAPNPPKQAAFPLEKAAYENTPNGIIKFIADDKLTLLESNSQFLTMTGYTEEELFSRGLLYFCAPLDREFVHRSIRIQAKNRDSLHLEFRFTSSSRASIWYQMSGTCVDAPQECPVYAACLCDTTETHALQARLQENAKLLQAKQEEINELYHTITSGFAKLIPDKWFTLLFANDRFFDLLGYTRLQIKNLFHNEIGRLIHSNDLDALRDAFSGNGRNRFSLRLRLLCQEGHFIWIQLEGSSANHFSSGFPVLYCFCTDISEQVEKEQFYLQQQSFNSLITSSIVVGTAIMYGRECETAAPAYLSDSLLGIIGYTREQFASEADNYMLSIIHPEDAERALRDFNLQCEESGQYEVEYRVVKRDGTVIWILEKGQKTLDENNNVIYVSIYLDITERKNRTDDLLHQSRHDSLTRLFNHAYTRQVIETYLAAQGDNHSSALMLLDLDNFKQVNDIYGHMEGDKILQSVAQILKSTFLSRDIIGRMGGDEFLIFLKDVHSDHLLKLKAQAICSAVRELDPAKYHGLSASIGIIHLQGVPATYEMLFQAADTAMYTAKFSGKDSWCLRCGLDDPQLREAEYIRPVLEAAGDSLSLLDLRNNYGWILSHICDTAAVIDLKTGRYTKVVFNGSCDFGTPYSGSYTETFPTLVKRDVIPEDRAAIWNIGELSMLRKAADENQKEKHCEYRMYNADNQLRWIRESFFFVRQNSRPVVFDIMRDITAFKEGSSALPTEHSHLHTLSGVFDILLEFNLSKAAYQVLKNDSSLIRGFPESGTLHSVISHVFRLLHPTCWKQLAHYRHLDETHPLYKQETGSVIENIFCRTYDGTYHHFCCILTPSAKNGDRTVLCFIADMQPGRNALSCETGGGLSNLFLDSERYHLALQQSGLIIFDWNAKEHTLYQTSNASRFRFSEVSGFRSDRKDLFFHTVYPEDWKLLDEFILTMSQPDTAASETTLRIQCRDDTYVWCKISAMVTHDANGDLCRILGTVADVDDEMKSKKQLEFHETHDRLTGLYNFSSFCTAISDRLEKKSFRPHALIYLDIKNFKYINDIYGYDTGDRLLQFFADSLSQQLPLQAFTGRLAADQFSIFVPYRSRQAMQDLFSIFAEQVYSYRDPATYTLLKIEISAGFYCIETSADIAPFEDMLNRASIAQKSIKSLAGSNCGFYSKALRDQMMREKERELSLFSALENGQFHIYLQPQISIQGKLRIFGAEALVRWIHPTDGIIPPNDFIPLFEQNGSITHLDHYVFEQVCLYLQERRSCSKPLYSISVNVSRVTIMEPSFAERYCSLKLQYGIPDGLLVLECTETAIIADLTRFQSILKTLQMHGFRIAMDDFGTGYSSLNLLKDIDIDILKLDTDFFRNTDISSKNEIVVSGILNMAKALHIHTLAEGVESLSLVEQLRSCGCDSIQGYVFSRPVPIEDFDQAIAGIASEKSKTAEYIAGTTEKKTAD